MTHSKSLNNPLGKVRSPGIALVAICLLGLLSLLLAACGDAPAQQQSEKTYDVGVFFDADNASFLTRFDGLKEGMKGLGYTEGKNVRYQVLNTSGQTPEQEQASLKEFGAKNYDAYWSVTATTAQKLKDIIAKKPIVIAGLPDAVAFGIVKSIEKPGGNLTGVDPLNTVLAPKRLELLAQLDPSIRSVYVIYNPKLNIQVSQLPAMREIASKNNLTLIEKPISTKEESKQLVPAFKASEAQAIMISGLLSYSLSGPELKEVVEREKLVMVGMERANLNLGAMFVYGANNLAIGKQSTEYVYKVLRGVDPGGLPILQPDKIEFVLNQKLADQWGRKFPEKVISSADELVK